MSPRGFMVGEVVSTEQELTKNQHGAKNRLGTCSSLARLLKLADSPSNALALFGGRPAANSMTIPNTNTNHDSTGESRGVLTRSRSTTTSTSTVLLVSSNVASNKQQHSVRGVVVNRPLSQTPVSLRGGGSSNVASKLASEGVASRFKSASSSKAGFASRGVGG